MKILLTNDDGFGSIGIRALDEVLTKAGHEVWVCAPAGAKSSTSHSLSFSNGNVPVEIENRRYSFDGQPADCIMASLGRKAIPFEPDVVVSGINAGFNLSIDILYSGTCGAASEAALWGYKAIAISAQKPENGNNEIYYTVARFLSEHLEEFMKNLSKDVMLNINMPQGADGKTWEIGKTFSMVHRDAAFPNDNGVIQNGLKDLERGVTDSDLAICASKRISVTPIAISPAIPEGNIEYLKTMLNR